MTKTLHWWVRRASGLNRRLASGKIGSDEYAKEIKIVEANIERLSYGKTSSRKGWHKQSKRHSDASRLGHRRRRRG